MQWHLHRGRADGFRIHRTQKLDMIIVDLAMRTGALGGLSLYLAASLA
jgi:hypothetical protein